MLKLTVENIDGTPLNVILEKDELYNESDCQLLCNCPNVDGYTPFKYNPIDQVVFCPACGRTLPVINPKMVEKRIVASDNQLDELFDQLIVTLAHFQPHNGDLESAKKRILEVLANGVDFVTLESLKRRMTKMLDVHRDMLKKEFKTNDLCKCGNPGHAVEIPIPGTKRKDKIIICPSCLENAVNNVANSIGNGD